MRQACTLALASLFALASILLEDTKAGPKRKFYNLPTKSRVVLAYAPQTPRVSSSCFPARLRGILAHISAQTGRRLVVTSGARHGGRRGSYHRRCMAADIRVPGVSVSRIIAAARSAPGIGGVGTYCNGIVHVDVGPHRRWRYC